MNDKYLNEIQASELIGLSPDWFRRGRCKGFGPPYIKLSNRRDKNGRNVGSVRYKESELRAWMDARKVEAEQRTTEGK